MNVGPLAQLVRAWGLITPGSQVHALHGLPKLKGMKMERMNESQQLLNEFFG